MQRLRVLFVSGSLGLGHVIRDLAIAAELRLQHGAVCKGTRGYSRQAVWISAAESPRIEQSHNVWPWMHLLRSGALT